LLLAHRFSRNCESGMNRALAKMGQKTFYMATHEDLRSVKS
jgi:hypothetical protein